jgi:acyl-CoA thioesterase
MTAPRPVFRSPFIEHLGIRFVSVGREGAELELPIRPEFLNSHGMVHGGVYASLGDTGLGAAIFGRLPEDRFAVTAEMSCRYLQGARAGTLICRAKVLHLGRTTAVAESEVFVDEVLQFKSSGTFMVMARS